MKKAQLLKKQIIMFTLICIIVSFVVPAFNKNVYAAGSTNGKKIAAASSPNGHPEAGDQANEVKIADYSNRPYDEVMRYKPNDDSEETKKVRETLAQMACNGAENDNIGYHWGDHSCYNAVKNIASHDLADITTKADTDCSAFISACVLATGYICNIESMKNFPVKSSKNMASGLADCGFESVKSLVDVVSGGNMEKGDILINTSNHVAMYVGDTVASTSGSATSGGTISIGHYTIVSQLTLAEIHQISADDSTIRLDDQNFNYNGEPKDISIVEKKSALEVISSIKNIVNYIFGVLVSGIRMAIVGYAEAIESFINNLLLDIEGTTKTDDQAEYTIEDLLYNRIPALDINIFSNTPGGKALNENSVLNTIRTLVAGWYYSVRNIAAVVMLIILLYTGLRMAITVSASEKADCSKQIVTWLKCMVLLFTIHYIIIAILNLNGIIVGLFSSASSKVESLHDTIEARAYDVRFTVGVTGAIMYITLMVYWVKFLLLYARRYAYNIIYIVIAPFMITRYALDNANTKGKAGFQKWLNQFVANVLIQPAHALAYSLFMGIAVDLALQSIGGFIIALVFMSQILKMDEYVLGIVRFNGNDASGHLHRMKKPMREELPVELYGQMKIYGAMAKNVGTIAKATVTPVGNYIKYRNYNEPKKVGLVGRINNKKDEWLIRRTLDDIKSNEMTEMEKQRNPDLAAEREKKIEKDKRKIELRKAKINARNGDKSSRRMLKLRSQGRGQVFKASAGTLKDVLSTVAGATMAIPLAVAESPEAGIAALQLIKTPSEQIDKYNKINKAQGERDKKENKIEETIYLVNQGNDQMDDLENDVNKRTKRSSSNTTNGSSTQTEEKDEEDYIEDIKEELRMVNKLDSNATNIEKLLKKEKQRYAYAKANSKTPEDSTQTKNVFLQDSIKNILNEMDKNDVLSDTQKEEISKKEAKKIIKDNKLKADATINDIGSDENIKKISYHFSETIVRNVVSEDNVELANKLNKIKDVNEKIKETNGGDKKAQINLNRFIEHLGTKA